ncbi:MAG: hypothetical protein PHC61_12250 [Chitinivibrionales bacterium]|nr:hypothetical protein [Chitinivibrionales bacterium]
MECTKWEESGLLCTSGELSGQSAVAFKNHCAECSYCREQLDVYKSDKSRFFTVDILGAKPSARVDQAVAMAAAAPARITATNWGLFGFVRKSVVPIMLFVLGFGAGAYFVLNVQNAKTTTVIAENKMSKVAERPVDSLSIRKMANNDSAIKPIDKPFKTPTANTADQILPVKE